MKKIKELTRAEEQIMHVLWKLHKAFVNDVIEELPVPKPAYNTVSTIIRILEKKGFIAHNTYGKSHEYYPLVAKKEYSEHFLQHFTKNYFNNSFPALVSCFAQDKNVSIHELDEVKQLIEELQNKAKQAKEKKTLKQQ